MSFKCVLALATLLLPLTAGAADPFTGTDYDCSRAAGIRCAVLRRDGSATLLIWQPETSEEEVRMELAHERQAIERQFEAVGGIHIVQRKINSITDQLVERACQANVCGAWHTVALPEANPAELWEQLSD